LTDSLTLASGEVLAAGTVLSEALTFRDTAALNVFYFALALIVMGVGYLKPNISTIVGKLYSKDDPRRDSGFTIFYMGINIGSFVATLLCGWLGETYGWKYGFGAAGIGMIIGLISFSWGQKFLHGHAEPSEPEKLTEKVFGPVSREWSIYLLSLPVLGVLWLLVQNEPVVLLTQNVFLIVAIVSIILYSMIHTRMNQDNKMAYLFAGITILAGIYTVLANLDHMPSFLPTSAAIAEYSLYLALALIVGFVVYGFMTHNSDEFGRTVVLMFLILTTVVFWALFEQSAGSMTLFADRVVDRTAGNVTFTAAQFGSLNAGFIMLLALPFAALWVWLAKRNLEPSTPVKFGLGIIQAGLGFGALVFGAQFPDSAGLSPVGLSAVTKLSIGRVVGVSMGTWFLATALSETVATRLGKMAALATEGGEVTDSAGALATYTQLFEFLMYVGVGVGIFVLLVSPLLRRGMHGVH
jgi:POT family proton-dependent oligopeptide transporter